MRNMSDTSEQKWIAIETSGEFVAARADMTLPGIYDGIGGGCDVFAPVGMSVRATKMFGRDDLVILIDEEGKLKNQSWNPLATYLAFGGIDGDIIVGRALIVKTGEDDDGVPDIVALDPEEARDIFDRINEKYPFGG